MMFFDNTMHPLEAMRPPGTVHVLALAERGRRDFTIRANILSKQLSGHDYMLGAEFSGADIVIGHSCFMAKHMGLLADHPTLEAYYERLQSRPTHQRAYGG